MIYVDDYRVEATVGRITGHWSHLWASPPVRSELITFTGRLGLKSIWIQNPDTPKMHFDVTDHYRQKAIRLGAVAVSSREGSLIQKNCRTANLCGLVPSQIQTWIELLVQYLGHVRAWEVLAASAGHAVSHNISFAQQMQHCLNIIRTGIERCPWPDLLQESLLQQTAPSRELTHIETKIGEVEDVAVSSAERECHESIKSRVRSHPER